MRGSSATPRHIASERRAVMGVALAMAAVMAGCGSSASNVGGGGHGSPDGAVRGFVNALTGWDGTTNGLSSVSEWVAPSQRTTFASSFGALAAFGGGVKISFKIDNFDVVSVNNTNSTHALVHVKGSGNFCYSGSVSGLSFNTCSSSSLTPSGTKDAVDTVNEGGQWYVDIGGASGGATTTTTTTTSTTTTTTTDTGTTTTTSTDTGTTTTTSTDTGTTSTTSSSSST